MYLVDIPLILLRALNTTLSIMPRASNALFDPHIVDESQFEKEMMAVRAFRGNLMAELQQTCTLRY